VTGTKQIGEKSRSCRQNMQHKAYHITSSNKNGEGVVGTEHGQPFAGGGWN